MAPREAKKGGGGGAAPGGDAYNRWVNDPGKVMAWMKKYNIRKMIDDSGGIVKIPNFLPTAVAEGALKVLESIPDNQWNATEAQRDQATNNIVHSFMSNKTAAGLPELTRAISMLSPGSLNTFSAGKYEQTDHIEPHDDRAYADVTMENGKVVQCSREIALIYYLTKDWKASYGGALIDVEGKTKLVPEFNSVVAFRIPRFHEVEPVRAPRPRYSIFGWFLLPGIRYPLWADESAAKAGFAAATAAGKRVLEGGGEEGGRAKQRPKTLAAAGGAQGGASSAQAAAEGGGGRAGKKARKGRGVNTILRKKRHLPMEYPGRGPRALKPATTSNHRDRVLAVC